MVVAWKHGQNGKWNYTNLTFSWEDAFWIFLDKLGAFQLPRCFSCWHFDGLSSTYFQMAGVSPPQITNILPDKSPPLPFAKVTVAWQCNLVHNKVGEKDALQKAHHETGTNQLSVVSNMSLFFIYNLVSFLEVLKMLFHFLMVLRFWVFFWMWFCVSVLRIKQVSWQIWRAPWQGWSRMNVLRECPIRLSRHIWGCFFRHVRRYFFKTKIPRTLNHPKALRNTLYISVAFQPFAGDMLHPYAQGDCDVRSNGLHTAHLWCEIQLPGPVERYGQTGSAGAFNEGMNSKKHWKTFW